MHPPICDKTAPPHLENPGSATDTWRHCREMDTAPNARRRHHTVISHCHTTFCRHHLVRTDPLVSMQPIFLSSSSSPSANEPLREKPVCANCFKKIIRFRNGKGIQKIHSMCLRKNRWNSRCDRIKMEGTHICLPVVLTNTVANHRVYPLVKCTCKKKKILTPGSIWNRWHCPLHKETQCLQCGGKQKEIHSFRQVVVIQVVRSTNMTSALEDPSRITISFASYFHVYLPSNLLLFVHRISH